jgi:glycerophosphoryl diester phosphodiesterase
LKRGRPGDERLPRRAATVLAGYSGPAALMSFEPAQIAEVRTFSPRTTRGLVAERHPAHIGVSDLPVQGRRVLAYWSDALKSAPQFLAYSVKDLPAALPFAARRLRGMPLLTWTVRSTDDRQRAVRYADQMIFEGFRP